MRSSKFYAVLTALAMAVGMTALVAGPAEAATSTHIKASLAGYSKVYRVYHGSIGLFDGQVLYRQSDGTAAEVYSGTAYLQRRWGGHKKWTTVAKDASPGYLYFGSTGSHAMGNADYRVYYTGGSSNGINWSSSYSSTIKVRTYYGLAVNGGKCHRTCPISGHIKPKYKKKAITVQIKKHGKWHTYKKVRTSKKSKFATHVKRLYGKHFRIVAKGNHLFLTTKSGVLTVHRG